MQSMPQSTACLTASAPWVWAATRSPPVRLVDDDAQFLVRIVLCPGLTGQRHDAARAAHLDQLGSVLDLVAHRLADLIDPVGDTFLDGQLQHARHERREHGRIQVPAGGRDGVTGGNDARTVDPPRIDGLTQGDVEQVAAGLDEQSEVANGGEAGAQGAAGVAHRAQHAGRGIVLHLGQAGVLTAAAHQQVDFHVHEAGQQDGVAEIDDLAFGFSADANYAVAVDTDNAGTNDRPGIDVDKTRSFEGQHD